MTSLAGSPTPEPAARSQTGSGQRVFDSVRIARDDQGFTD